MSDQDPEDGGLEAGLRWLAEQVGRSVDRLQDIDLDLVARRTGLDAERLRELMGNAEQWLSQADNLASGAAVRFSGLVDDLAHGQTSSSRVGPHPLDMPSESQGLALSAIDSGRWSVGPGSHVLTPEGEGPAPDDEVGLVGDLRARDWISASGEVTLAGRNALKRWLDRADAR